MNIIYLVTLLSVIIVGIYGYKYVSPNDSPNPHTNVPRNVSPTQTPTFDEKHYQHLLAEVNSNPSGFDENVNLANFLFDNHRFNEAIKYYENALKINSQAADVLVDAGVSHFNLNQFEKAKNHFDRALKADSQHINALYNMGVVSARLGNMQDMQTYWTKLIEVAPHSEQARGAQQMLDQVRNSNTPNP